MGERHRVICLVIFGLVSAGPRSPCAPQQPEPALITAVEPSSAVTTPGSEVSVFGRNFSPDSAVYFGGLQARQITYINSGTLRAVTPYLRPGTYRLDLKSGEALIHSDVSFAALPAPVDSDLDQAEGLAAKNNAKAAIAIFTSIAVTHPDYDVRAYAHYRAGQFYLAQGDIWNGAEQAALIWDAKVSTAVQSSWRYRLLYDQTAYSVSESNDQETDLKVVNAAIKWDVTESPQLRFWRSLVAARLGKMERAKEDLKFILGADPHNVPYRALAAYIGVLTGDETELEALRNEQVDDVRALALLGQAAYLADKHDSAQGWWAAQAKIGVTQAKLDCLAGRKHVHYRQTRVAAALLAECIAVAPDSSEGKAAKSLLATLTNPVP